MSHMLRKSKSNNHIKLEDIKRCSDGGNFAKFINFGTFSVDLQMDITQCKRNTRVLFQCHHKAHGLASYFLKYRLNMIKSLFTNYTFVKSDIETKISDLRLSFKMLSFFENSLFKGNFEIDQVY